MEITLRQPKIERQQRHPNHTFFNVCLTSMLPAFFKIVHQSIMIIITTNIPSIIPIPVIIITSLLLLSSHHPVSEFISRSMITWSAKLSKYFCSSIHSFTYRSSFIEYCLRQRLFPRNGERFMHLKIYPSPRGTKCQSLLEKTQHQPQLQRERIYHH